MTAPLITALPAAPSRADDGPTFSGKADAFLGALPTFQGEANAQAIYLNGRVSAAFAAGLESAAENAAVATAQAVIATERAVAANNSAVSSSGSSAAAGNSAAAAFSSAGAANAALLALSTALANGIGMFQVNADGDLIAEYNTPTVTSMTVNASGELLVTY